MERFVPTRGTSPARRLSSNKSQFAHGERVRSTMSYVARWLHKGWYQPINLWTTSNLLTLSWFAPKRRTAPGSKPWSMRFSSSVPCSRSGSSLINQSRFRSTKWRKRQFTRLKRNAANLSRPYLYFGLPRGDGLVPARSAMRHAHAREAAGLYRNRCADAGSRYWREYRHL